MGNIHQLQTSRIPLPVAGTPYDPPYSRMERNFPHPSGKAAQVTTVTPTAVNDFVYQLKVAGETLEYTADGTATQTEISDGLRAAIAANPIANGQVSTSGTTTLIITARNKAVTVPVEDVAGNLAVVATTAAAEASEVSMGVFVYHDGSGNVVETNPGTARVLNVDVDNANNSQLYELVLEVNGDQYEISYTSDGTATANEIVTGLKASIDALTALAPYITATLSTDTLVITATVAGFAAFDILSWDTDLAVSVATAGDDATTLVAGISRYLYDEADEDEDGTAKVAANRDVAVLQRAGVYMESSESPSFGDQVFIGQAAAERGKAFASQSTANPRLPLPKSQAIWEEANKVRVTLV